MPFSHSRGEADSSMIPMEALTWRKPAISCSVMQPALICGNKPVSASTLEATSLT